jgi:hypothetical protein
MKAELNDLSEEQWQLLIKELEEHCEVKQTGARASNASATQDMRQTMEHITNEVNIWLFGNSKLTLTS